jgi:hypothetical protein
MTTPDCGPALDADVATAPEPEWDPQPGRERVVEGLAHWLSRSPHGLGLRVIARDVLGEGGGRIDLVALGPDGRASAVLVGESERDLELVALGLAQRAWLAARLPDWLQLAPDLDLRPERGVGLLLVAPGFGPAARRAAGSLGPGAVELAVYRCLRSGGPSGLLVERLPAESESGPHAARPSGPREIDTSEGRPCAGLPPFRSGLSDEELALTPEERREFDEPA